MDEIKYIHDEVHHNLYDPTKIVPFLIELIKPQSVLDVGCGIGTFLKLFRDNGITDVIGIDGEWVNCEMLNKNIELSAFKIFDLEEEFYLSRKFDLVISLEVAEHIHEKYADVFIANLVHHSDIIVFSAAFPGQGGQNHFNEQWPEYWIDKFNAKGYQMLDYLRPALWKIEKLAPWYKQNMFLFVRKSRNLENNIIVKELQPLLQTIHPDFYIAMLKRNQVLELLNDEVLSIKKGKEPIIFYLKLFIKSILRKFKLK